MVKLEEIDYNKLIFENLSIDKISLYCEYMQECIFLEKYNDVIELGNRLLKENIESYETAYYNMLGTLGINDLYLCMLYIKKSIILNQDESKAYLEEDGANYFNLLKEDENIQKALIICAFAIDCVRCFKNCNDKIEIGIKYFELISNLYEWGYSPKIIKELTTLGHIIYQI